MGRSLHHQKGNTLYGSEDPSWPHSQPSNKCGSPNKNTTNPALELYTENASKLIFSFRIHAYEGNRNYISEFIFLSQQLDKNLLSYHVLQLTTIIFSQRDSYVSNKPCYKTTRQQT